MEIQDKKKKKTRNKYDIFDSEEKKIRKVENKKYSIYLEVDDEMWGYW